VTAEERCRAVQERLTDAMLGRRPPGDADGAHAAGCAACGALLADLRALADALDAIPAPELPEETAVALRRRLAAELSAPAEIRAGFSALPEGYRRELFRLLAWAALPLPAVLALYAVLFHFGGALLAEWLPSALVSAIGCALALGAASWMALIYGAIPFVAQREAARRSAHRLAAATPLDSR
jgi:hypothetical protein